MRKKFLLVVLVVSILSSICLVFASAATTENITSGLKTLKAAGVDTCICTLRKDSQNIANSAFKVYSNNSTINKMNVWVQSTEGRQMSNKYTVYPNDTPYTLYYYTDITFQQNGNVVFVGEQYNVLAKIINYKAAAH